MNLVGYMNVVAFVGHILLALRRQMKIALELRLYRHEKRYTGRFRHHDLRGMGALMCISCAVSAEASSVYEFRPQYHRITWDTLSRCYAVGWGRGGEWCINGQ